MSEKPKGAFEGTLDSVTSTVAFLWDFLSAPPRPVAPPEPEPEVQAPSLLEWLPKSEPPKKDGQIPAEVIDTEGEET